MVKVNANSNNRSEVTQICDVFRGKIIDVAKDSLVVEATGNENKITAFLEMIEPFGIIELARTEQFLCDEEDLTAKQLISIYINH